MDSGNGNKKIVPNGEPEVGTGTGDTVVEGRSTPPTRETAQLRNGHDQEVKVGGTVDAVKRKVPPTKPTRSSSLPRNQWLPFKVFDNELLRKKILGFAIFSGGNKMQNRNNARSLRLVGKTWNETVIKLLYKRQEPLLQVSNVASEGHLERFCSMFSSSTLINGFTLPFSLLIFYDEESEGLPTGFYKVLNQCGSGLVQLNVKIITKGESCKSHFPIWSFPRLGKLNVTVFSDQRGDRRHVVNFGQSAGQTFGSALYNALREAATSNVEFNMTLLFGLSLVPGSRIAHQPILKSIAILPTITSLTLKYELQNADVDVLIRKPIPNLTSLTLYLPYELLEKGSFFMILDNYRTSLRKLFIDDFSSPPLQSTLIRFPIMEKLHELFFNSNNLELEPGLISLEEFFPKLHTLRLHNQNVAMFGKWTGCSKFASVTDFDFSVNILCYTMETVQSVNFAFPNLRKLSLIFSGTDTSGLKYLFQEMIQLTELTLVCRRVWPEVDANFWDAVLTGVSIETIAESREHPGFWDRFNRDEQEALNSIQNLQELTSLTLSGYFVFNQWPPLITDVTFKGALLKMPKLKKLYLHGSFVASAEMSEEWRNGGRSLEYEEY